MVRHRLSRILTLACVAALPAVAAAAVSDWYGTWEAAFTGSLSSGTCPQVTVSAGNASQASISMYCNNSLGGPPFVGSGSISASGSLNMGGSATGTTGGYTSQITFGGSLQGNSGQGQWTSTAVTPSGPISESGTWTMTRLSAPQPVAPDPNQSVAVAPAAQTEYSAYFGQLPAEAVTVSPTGTLGRASLSVTLDPSRIPVGGGFAAAGRFAVGDNLYNIYVAALVPAGVLGLTDLTWFQYPSSHAWAVLGSPIGAYQEGVAQGATGLIVINILQDLDVTGLLGSEIYVGYGLSDTEMLNAGRYRGVYIVR